MYPPSLKERKWCYLRFKFIVEHGKAFMLIETTVGATCDKIEIVADKEYEYPKEMKGKHYSALIEDDMIDAYKYAMSALKDTMALDPGCLTVGEQECYESLMKGDDDMTKYLWHIILFNTKTEIIDYKAYIPASSGSDAQMLAAQKFGKFDPKVHAVNCKQIMSYGTE